VKMKSTLILLGILLNFAIS
jgi:hypothetical protein